jgi:hypothetical protein
MPVRTKQIGTLAKQITCWMTTLVLLFCTMTPLHGICNCDTCPHSGSIDSQSLNANVFSTVCVGSVCCPQYENDKDNVFDFCTCVCTDSPQPLTTDSNQILKLNQKNQFPNTPTPHLTKSLLPAVLATVDKINIEISDYSEFHNSPLARSTTRIHLLLNIWQN